MTRITQQQLESYLWQAAVLIIATDPAIALDHLERMRAEEER
jgi:hypothetical protein